VYALDAFGGEARLPVDAAASGGAQPEGGRIHASEVINPVGPASFVLTDAFDEVSLTSRRLVG
jgi:hypothetical protein